jgi:outer membrane protein
MKLIMKRILLSIALLHFLLNNEAQEVRMNLRQCIETGLAYNLDVLQSQLQVQTDKVNMNQAKLNLLPDLNGAVSQTFSQGRSIDPYSNSPVTQAVSSSNYSLSSGVILFNGLSLMNAIKQNSLAYEASKMDWQQIKDNLTINIILAYLQVLSANDRLTVSKSQAELSAGQVSRLEVMNQQGAIKPSDLSDLKGQYASDQLAILNVENDVETAKISLCQLMNIPYTKDLVLEKIEPESFAARYESTRDQVYQAALQELAIVKAVDFREKSAEKAVKVMRGQLYPTLSFGANISTAYSSVALQNQYVSTTYVPTSDSALVNNIKYPVYSFKDNFSQPTKIGYRDQLDNNVFTSVGFSLRVPIFNSLFQRNRVKLAKINLQDRQLIAKTTRSQLGRNVDQAYINMLSAFDRYKVSLEQVSAYEESFHAAEIRFNNGVGTSVDYLVARVNYDRANINLVIAKYDYVLRTKILDFYQGKQLW